MANLETLLCSLKAILSCNAINASHVNLICDHIKSSNVWIRRTRGLMIWGTQQAKEYWQALSILSSGSPRWAEVLGTFQKEKKKKSYFQILSSINIQVHMFWCKVTVPLKNAWFQLLWGVKGWSLPLSQRWLHGNFLLGGYFLQLWTNDSFSGWLFSSYLNGCFSQASWLTALWTGKADR